VQNALDAVAVDIHYHLAWTCMHGMELENPRPIGSEREPATGACGVCTCPVVHLIRRLLSVQMSIYPSRMHDASITLNDTTHLHAHTAWCVHACIYDLKLARTRKPYSTYMIRRSDSLLLAACTAARTPRPTRPCLGRPACVCVRVTLCLPRAAAVQPRRRWGVLLLRRIRRRRRRQRRRRLLVIVRWCCRARCGGGDDGQAGAHLLLLLLLLLPPGVLLGHLAREPLHLLGVGLAGQLPALEQHRLHAPLQQHRLRLPHRLLLRLAAARPRRSPAAAPPTRALCAQLLFVNLDLKRLLPVLA
jgi:hypothetical protein